MFKNGNLSSVILWSVISAAFIGPGTVTTAATAGTLYQLDLLWAVSFATIACILLQEVSTRLTIISGLSMGQTLRKKYGERKSILLRYILGGPVILGCAAYEAGNILGAVSGLQLMMSIDTWVITLMITLTVVVILWTERRNAIGWMMTLLVAMMGVAFLALAATQHFTFGEYAAAAVTPKIPAGSELITLGLVGTTIVPYNLFLGSGISKGQTIPLMRIGLTISVFIGGLITAAILIAGTGVNSFSNFNELGDALSQSLGPIGGLTLGVGLFAAGFSSAITSPYAASVIASAVFDWNRTRQRMVWMVVVLTGFIFGISGIKPIPVILTVQALNGLVLPLLTAYLILLINDPVIVPSGQRNSPVYNLVLLIIFGSVLMMGLNNLDKSFSAWLGFTGSHLSFIGTSTAILTFYLGYRLWIIRRT